MDVEQYLKSEQATADGARRQPRTGEPMSLRSDLLDLAENLRAEAEAHTSRAKAAEEQPRHAIDWATVAQAAADKATALMASYCRTAVLSILAKHESNQTTGSFAAAAAHEGEHEDHR